MYRVFVKSERKCFIDSGRRKGGGSGVARMANITALY
jgi:hypothetical protein